MDTKQQTFAHQDIVLEQHVARPISQSPDYVEPPFGSTSIMLSAALRAIAVRIECLAEQAVTAEGAHGHWEPDAVLQQLIAIVASIVDAHDNADAGHLQRVARYAAALGQVLGLSAIDLTLVHTAGLLHDLGKVGIPEAILHKPALLTAEEYGVVKQHPLIGEQSLVTIQPLREVARIVGEHHERYDGQGYPRGTAGPAISLGARILAVADALDAILSNRPYRTAHELLGALAELDRCAGTQFDPEVVAAVHRLVATREPAFFTGPARHPAAHRTRASDQGTAA